MREIQVLHNQKKPKDFLLKGLTIPVVAIIIVMVCSFIVIGKLGQDYREYKGYLTDSIVYAVDHRSASAEGEGVANFILEENLNRIWNYITIRDMGKRKSEMPGAQAEYALDFGDGSRIMFWGVPPEKKGKVGSLIVAYEKTGGYLYIYESPDMQIDAIQKYLSADWNAPKKSRL